MRPRLISWSTACDVYGRRQAAAAGSLLEVRIFDLHVVRPENELPAQNDKCRAKKCSVRMICWKSGVRKKHVAERRKTNTAAADSIRTDV